MYRIQKDTVDGFEGRWMMYGGEWTSKQWAEENAEKLRGRGYTARVHSTTQTVKVRGEICWEGERWFAQKFRPDEAVDFRKGRWVKYKDPSNKSLDLTNLIPIDGSWDPPTFQQGVIFSEEE